MGKILENKYMIGTVVFLILLFYVGGIISRNMDISNSVGDTTSINM